MASRPRISIRQSTAGKTPARRDLVAPFVKALRDNKLRVGLYYSHLDWSHPDYDVFIRGQYRYRDDPARWERFLRFHRGQLAELVSQFKPDLLWFDGDWEHSAEEWGAASLRDTPLTWHPPLVLNGRINGYGDYASPEHNAPIIQPDGPWELCLTMNDWGYQDDDHNYKTPYQLIRIFADVIGGGGKLLPDIGPRADGTVPAAQEAILREMGHWMHKHAEAIYGTIAGIPPGHFYGPTTLSGDRQPLYLSLPRTSDKPEVVRGLKNHVHRIRIVANGTKIKGQILGKQYWNSVPGILYMNVPVGEADPTMTVIALQLKGEVDLHR